MISRPVTLDFGSLKLEADLFDHPVARALMPHLPVTINLTQWGGELYGPLPADLGIHHPVSDIPPGGIAYSQSGAYLCVFFGQTPAWPVDYIGRISGEGWKHLVTAKNLDRLEIRPV